MFVGSCELLKVHNKQQIVKYYKIAYIFLPNVTQQSNMFPKRVGGFLRVLETLTGKMTQLAGRTHHDTLQQPEGPSNPAGVPGSS